MEKFDIDNVDDKDIQEKEFLEIIMDKSSNILIDSVISSKKKLLNAQNGNSELFSKTRLKAKALDFLIMILRNNNDLKQENIYLVDEYISILNSSKNDKSVFEQISPKIKQLIALTVKNQIKIGNHHNFSKLVNSIIEVMNLHFDQSFLQQIVDLIKNNALIFENFILKFLSKFFQGRNIIFKMQDIRYFIKLNLSNKGTFYFLKHIIKYIKPKNLGGSRTNHQLTQCLQILNYVLEISSNKIKENDKFLNDLVEKQEDFKQTLALLDSSFQELFASEKESNSDGNKTSSLNGIIIFTHRLFSFLKKYTKIINKLNPEYNEISKIFRKITSQMKKLIINRTELKIHEEKLMSIEETFN